MLLPLVVAVSSVPPGFAPTDELAIFRRDPNDEKAPDWTVFAQGDRLIVESSVAWYARRTREEKARSKRPGTVTINLGMSKGTVLPREGVSAFGVWLHAFDLGEFGGGIYALDEKGSKPFKVSDDNTPCLVATPKGVYAVQALAHLMFWYSRLIRVDRVGGRWQTKTVTDLHVAPAGVVWTGRRFLYSTGEYVSTLELDGTQQEVYRGRGRFRTESMAALPSGEVWIGSSHGLLRLSPKGDGYAPQWYLPKGR